MLTRAALLWLLTSDNPVSRTGALIGLNLFPVELPQAPPALAVVYNLISGKPGYTMQGPTRATPYRYQIDAFANTVAALDDLGAAIIADLSGFRGLIPVSPSVDVQGIFADNQSDSAEAALETSGSKTKRRSLDFIVWITEG
jgi:hypothetical protein